ncbi:GtrA family protein [Nocardioides sp. CPCC 205120]|uniref:GtrA family protein n=1 Tax=Nocardioides sp. CPCC 205120 TaxID=3406462 RepID=UPI003B5142C5
MRLLRRLPPQVRFAGVGVVNTALDVGLFWLLHVPLGITLANLVSTSAGMTFSFVVNGLFTFDAARLTLRHALLFVATTGATMWVLQPLVIHALLWVVDPVIVAKVLAIGCSLVVNFAAYRFVVWPRRAAEPGAGA